MLRCVFNSLADVFVGESINSLPGSLPDADNLPGHSQKKPLSQLKGDIKTPEELLAAVNADPARLLKIFREQQATIEEVTEMNSQWKQREEEFDQQGRAIGEARKELEKYQARQVEGPSVRRQRSPTRRPNYTFNDEQPTRKSPKFPDPDQYDGNRADLKGFVYKFKSKLSSNIDWYATERDLVRYSVTRLKGTAEQRILPLVQPENDSGIVTMTQFYKALETAFGDPDRTATAQHYIQNFKQANRPFAQFLADFEANIHDTGFHEANQRFFFEEGLSSELRTFLIPTQAHNLSFTELKTLCQHMDNEHRRIKPFVPGARANDNIINNNHTASRGPGPAPAQPAANRSTNDQNTAMDLLVMNARPRGPLTPELRQYRMDNKLCLYAGCTGHLAKDCPLLETANERRPPYDR